MDEYKVVLKSAAVNDIATHKKSGTPATKKKIDAIMLDLALHPKTGVGQPEQLKGALSGLWSRRINSKDRIIYSIEENIVTVFVLSAMGHYGDK